MKDTEYFKKSLVLSLKSFCLKSHIQYILRHCYLHIGATLVQGRGQKLGITGGDCA